MANEPVSNAQVTTEAKAKEPKKFPVFGGLIDRIRSARELSKAEILLETSIRRGNFNGEAFKDALGAFEGLQQPQKEKMLTTVGEVISRYTSFPFENAIKTTAITMLAAFTAEAAAIMPKATGGIITNPPTALIRELKKVSSDNTLFLDTDQTHVHAKLAAAVALWELGYMDSLFWTSCLKMPALRDFTIIKMLEMPYTDNFADHGWHLLRQNLSTDLAISIALNPSPKKIDFFTSMMLDSDSKVVSHSLEGAIYLNPLPTELLETAAEISKRSEELNVKASYFLSAAHMRPLLTAADNTQFLAAMQLVMLYHDGMSHLRFLLESVVEPEMKDVLFNPGGSTPEEKGIQQHNAANVLLQLHLLGFRTEGVIFNTKNG